MASRALPDRARAAWPGGARRSPARCFSISSIGSCCRRDGATRPALPRSVRRLQSRLPHLHLARIRQPRRHLPPARRARPHRPEGDGRRECERLRALSVLVEEFRRRGYEFAAHGSHATRMLTSRMSESRGARLHRVVHRARLARERQALRRAGSARTMPSRAHAGPARRGRPRIRRRLAERRPALPDGRTTASSRCRTSPNGTTCSSCGTAACCAALCRDRRRGRDRTVRRGGRTRSRPIHRACTCIPGLPECRIAFRMSCAPSRRSPRPPGLWPATAARGRARRCAATPRS